MDLSWSEKSEYIGIVGRRGENETRILTFDCTSALQEYPEAEILCIMQRPGDTQPYTHDYTQDGNTITVALASADMCRVGTVKLELRLMQGEKILKSAIYRGGIALSLHYGEPECGEAVDLLNRIDKTLKDATETAARLETSLDGVDDAIDRLDAATDSATATDKQAQENEKTRGESEKKRIKAEDGRILAENSRQQQENERADAEGKRVQAEQERVTAEQGRMEAETKREETMAQHAEKIAELEAEVVKKAEIDDTTVSDTNPWSSAHIIDVLCPKASASGNPVVVKDALGGMGLTECKATFTPTQAGSGTPLPDNIRPISGRDSVKVERCGENLLSPEKILYKTFTPYGLIINYIGDNKITLKGTYNTDGGSFVIAILSDHALSGRGYKITAFGDTKKMSFYGLRTKDEAAIAVQSSFAEGEIVDATIQLFIYAGTPPPAAYTPYTGQTTTLTLPRTMYGGEVDVRTGEGLETWKLITFDGTESWTIIPLSNGTNYLSMQLDNDFPATSLSIDTAKKEHLQTHFAVENPYSVATNNIMWALKNPMSVNGEIRVRATPYTNSVDSWKSYLAAQYAAGTPVQVAYKLATPVPFTATGSAEIKALEGVNTLLSDGDTISATYTQSPAILLKSLSAQASTQAASTAALERAVTDI